MAGGPEGNDKSKGGNKTAVWIGVVAIVALIIIVLVATRGGDGGGGGGY